jgi:hypothetical protein
MLKKKLKSAEKTEKIIAKTNYDSGWKFVIEKYLQMCLEYFYPELNKNIDWTKKITFLDKELEKIIPESKTGKKFVDKLVEVYYKDGQKKWIMLHIEFQQAEEKDFPKRIYIYNYKIFDLHKKDTISFVLLGDKNKKWRPDKFNIKYEGFELYFKYKVVKLIDYANSEDELIKSKNPFCLIVLSHLKRLEAGNDLNKQFSLKLQLIKQLYKIGFNRQDIININMFIDWLFQLPPKLEMKYVEEKNKIEEVKKMPLELAEIKVERYKVQQKEKAIQQKEKAIQQKDKIIQQLERQNEEFKKLNEKLMKLQNN